MIHVKETRLIYQPLGRLRLRESIESWQDNGDGVHWGRSLGAAYLAVEWSIRLVMIVVVPLRLAEIGELACQIAATASASRSRT